MMNVNLPVKLYQQQEVQYDFRENNGRRLVRHTAIGDRKTVTEILISKNVGINYSSSDLYEGAPAIMVAATHGHIEIFDTTLKALVTSSPLRNSHVRPQGKDMPRVVKWLKSANTDFNHFRGFLRVLVATLSCLCPRNARVNTICEKLSLRQYFVTGVTKSECKWGDRLRDASWPALPQTGIDFAFVKSDDVGKDNARRFRSGGPLVNNQGRASLMPGVY